MLLRHKSDRIKSFSFSLKEDKITTANKNLHSLSKILYYEFLAQSSKPLQDQVFSLPLSTLLTWLTIPTPLCLRTFALPVQVLGILFPRRPPHPLLLFLLLLLLSLCFTSLKSLFRCLFREIFSDPVSKTASLSLSILLPCFILFMGFITMKCIYFYTWINCCFTLESKLIDGRDFVLSAPRTVPGTGQCQM